MKKAIFFDRDGVINVPLIKDNKPYPPPSLSKFEFSYKIPELLSFLKENRFLCFIFTNQPDVARGTQTKESVEEINSYIMKRLPIDKIYTCYHDSKDNCNCRKPKPGMILEAVKEYGIELSKSFVIGDRWRDIEAGVNASCRTIFIDYHYSEELKSKPTYSYHSIEDLYKSKDIFI